VQKIEKISGSDHFLLYFILISLSAGWGACIVLPAGLLVLPLCRHMLHVGREWAPAVAAIRACGSHRGGAADWWCGQWLSWRFTRSSSGSCGALTAGLLRVMYCYVPQVVHDQQH
jgi:membrane protein YqaA with SNARE-associated domain